MLPGLCMADVPAVEIAGKLEAPVPAPGRLQQVAAKCPHRPQLGRRSKRARFAQGLRDLRVDLELREGRPCSDSSSGNSAGNRIAKLDQLFGANDPVA